MFSRPNKLVASSFPTLVRGINPISAENVFPLQLRHKAAEVIRQQLETRETALLYCMLGDATDEVEHYERALAMTEGRSARAHRALGMHHYFREAIQ